jgi:hypothetical protein
MSNKQQLERLRRLSSRLNRIETTQKELSVALLALAEDVQRLRVSNRFCRKYVSEGRLPPGDIDVNLCGDPECLLDEAYLPHHIALCQPPSRPRELHPGPLTDSVLEPLDSHGSCHP